MDENEIKYVLESYDIYSDIDCVCGDWVVTKDGDIVNVIDKFPIYKSEVHHDHWLAHFKQKKRFDRSSFLNAFNRACEILNINVELKEDY